MAKGMYRINRNFKTRQRSQTEKPPRPKEKMVSDKKCHSPEERPGPMTVEERKAYFKKLREGR